MSVKNVGAELSRSMFGNGITLLTCAGDLGTIDPFSGCTQIVTTGTDVIDLQNATPGTMLYIYVMTDGGTGQVEPVTSTGWDNLVIVDDGDGAWLLYVDDTIGWVILSVFGAAAPPLFTAAD